MPSSLEIVHLLVACLPLSLVLSPASAQSVVRASVSTGGSEANVHSPLRAGATNLAVSGNGRFVAFVTPASNLVSGDTNGVDDAFVRDLEAGTTERVSVSTGGAQGLPDKYGRSVYDVAISADGRFVSFSSAQTKLIDGEKGGGGRVDVYVRDRVALTTERLSLSTSGGAANGDSAYASISADGRYVAFYSHATNLVASDRNRATDVFVRDRWTRTTVRASVDSAGREANSSSLTTTNGAFSADGRCVVFVSSASNLVVGDTNGIGDVFVRNLEAGATERVNLTPSGGQLAGGVSLGSQSVSGNGRYVTYVHRSTNADELPPDVPTGVYHAFRFDRVTRTTDCVSRGPSGAPADLGVGSGMIGQSADGRYVAFVSRSTNLVPGFPATHAAVFRRDSWTGAVTLVDPGLGNTWPDGPVHSWQVVLDVAGATVVFASEATNLVLGDTNGARDVFAARGL